MITSFGYPAESKQVLSFLKGIGEYDPKTHQYHFTIRSLYDYRELMASKNCTKGNFETNFKFWDFFFKSMSTNGLEITEQDLDEAIVELEIDKIFSSASTEKVILRSGGDVTGGVTFAQMEDKLKNLEEKPGRRRGTGFNDA